MDTEEWDVEGIRDSRIDPVKGFQYRVAWSGPHEDTWQPPSDLDCYVLVNAYHASNPDRPRPEARELKRIKKRTFIKE